MGPIPARGGPFPGRSWGQTGSQDLASLQTSLLAYLSMTKQYELAAHLTATASTATT